MSKGDVEMSKVSAAITHSGAVDATTGLTIKSTSGFVDVEAVRFTDKIGVSGDPDLVSLSSSSVSVSGTLKLLKISELAPLGRPRLRLMRPRVIP